MFVPRYESPSEEAFALASLKEFVKLWGSGSRATFQIGCNNGQAFLQFSSQLGAPADRHFVPPIVPRHPQHGLHAEQPVHHHPRQKSQKQRERDLARAVAHRAAQDHKTDKTVNPAEKDSSDSDNQQQVVQKPATPAGVSASPASGVPLQELPPPPPSKEQAAVSATSQLDSGHAAPAEHEQAVPNAQDTAAAASPLVVGPVTFNEVQDEFHKEDSEVKVFTTGVFENCPDEKLSEDYFVSLRKFICSENHLENNISCVKFAHLSSRQINRHFVHTVKVEISVKTAPLWEPPLAYLKRHLASNDWLKGNKTRITLREFSVL